MAVKVPKSMMLRACVYPSPDVEGYYVAHCLELDLIGEGRTPKFAIKELIEAIEIQIQGCDDISQLFFPAPASVWKRFKESHDAGRVIMSRIVAQAAENIRESGYLPIFQNVVATKSVPERYLQPA